MRFEGELKRYKKQRGIHIVKLEIRVKEESSS